MLCATVQTAKKEQVVLLGFPHILRIRKSSTLLVIPPAMKSKMKGINSVISVKIVGQPCIGKSQFFQALRELQPAVLNPLCQCLLITFQMKIHVVGLNCQQNGSRKSQEDIFDESI